MWSKWFPNAHIHGVDLHKILPLGERVTHYRIDCTHPRTAHLVWLLKPDVIIDDAAHTMRSHQEAFELAFPSLKSGGLYIFEDLQTCYYPEFGGSATHLGEPLDEASARELQGQWGRTLDWLSELSHAVHYSLYSDVQRAKILEKYPWFDAIEEVSFLYGMVVIKKSWLTSSVVAI